MSINSLSPIGAASTIAAGGTTSVTNLSAKTSEQFMMILLAQLRNQNPMEPMKDNEMMAQMTSLNSLQELQAIKGKMEQMAAANSAGYAASLIGKKVKALMPDGTTEEGVVDSMAMQSGLYLLEVNGKQVSLASVVQISAPPPAKITPTVAPTPAANIPLVFAAPTSDGEYSNP